MVIIMFFLVILAFPIILDIVILGGTLGIMKLLSGSPRRPEPPAS